MVFNFPLLVLTSDTDWASDACIEDLVDRALSFGIRPVMMATGKSAAVEKYLAAGSIELGIHPNFNPGSDHGADPAAVIAHVRALYPQATTWRSHGFVDSTQIAAALYASGLEYDSNLCLWMQPNLAPLRHASGSLRFPVFWEDDVHWRDREGSWTFDDYAEQFFSPGLKVINVHPLAFAMNIPHAEFRKTLTPDIKTLTQSGMERRRFRGAGTRTFLLDLFKEARARGHRFYTLAEACELWSSATSDTAGRTLSVSEEEYSKYWRADNAEKQRLLKDLYNKRNPADLYATSRDINLRELEIEAIRRSLIDGDLIDLGCGNGYTLISLARHHLSWRMVGVDFSESLIAGAHALLQRERPPLQNSPQFVCADAIEYLNLQPDASAGAIISERFLLNMPDARTQEAIVADAYRVLRSGGRLILCEASSQGFAALNSVRRSVGLDVVPETSPDNLSAIRFDEAVIEAFARRVGFRLVDKLGFSVYFAISRVLHPLLVAPQKPSFDARINTLARSVQAALPFSPGVGANIVWVLEKPQMTAATFGSSAPARPSS